MWASNPSNPTPSITGWKWSGPNGLFMVKILSALFVSLLLVNALNGQSVRTGSVSGALFDPQDSVILGTEVTVSRQGFQESVFPDPQTGRFAFNLAPGVYTISTKQNWWFSI